MSLLPAGKVANGDDLNRLRAVVDSQRLASGAGYRFSFGANGATFGGGNPFTNRTPPTPTTTRYPFKVIDVSDADDPKIQVVPGAVNSATPTYDGTSLLEYPAITLAVGGDDLYLEIDYDSAWLATAYRVVVSSDVSNPSAVPGASGTARLLLASLTALASPNRVVALNFIRSDLQWAPGVGRHWWVGV